MIVHPIPPVYDENSRVLILGSFPSVKSREEGFFYGHKQNRFWSVIARICGEDTPSSVEEKRSLLLRHNIALWDVIHSCDIDGSADSSIKNVIVNDPSIIFDNADISLVITNGKTADRLYKKYLEKATGITALCLPSTSPANAAFSADRLYGIWNGAINEYMV